MRILMVSKDAGGGAGIAARRQVEALNALGHSCKFLSLHEDWDGNAYGLHADRDQLLLVAPGQDSSLNSAIAAAYSHGNRTPISNTWMSYWPSVLAIDAALLQAVEGFDVVHLHWIAHFVSSAAIERLRSSGRRIVITGHDMNYFTGGCHYSAGCTSYIDACRQCPQLVSDPLALVAQSYDIKRSTLSSLSASWIFPSRWLADCFRASAIGQGHADVRVVHNCLDTALWSPPTDAGRQALRIGLGVLPKDTLVVAGAQDNTEKRKGFDFIEAALNEVERDVVQRGAGGRLVLVTFGAGCPQITQASPWMQHLHMGTLDEAGIAKLFRCADLLLFPSREENFSNAVLEALLCGCPVLGFRIGGVPEIVEDGVNGRLVVASEQAAYTAALRDLLSPHRLGELRVSTLRWREQHASDYSGTTIARQLEAAYAAPAPRAPSEVPKPPTGSGAWHSINLLAFAEDRTERHAFLGKLRRVASMSRPLSERRTARIPAFFVGFGSPEVHVQWGSVQWIKQCARVVFTTPRGGRPLLLLQIPNRDEVVQWAHLALGVLKASLDGKPLLASWVIPDGSRFAYLCLDAGVEQPDRSQPQTFSLDFDTPTVSLDIDSRGLCMLVSAAAVFDVSVQPGALVDTAPDVACMLLATQISDPDESGDLADRRSGAAWLDLSNASRRAAASEAAR